MAKVARRPGAAGAPNLRVLRPSRTKLAPGDLFVLSPAPRLFLFGRVIAIDAVAGPITGLNLIYIYDVRRASPEPVPVGDLSRGGLLLPPLMTNRLPWSRGYFDAVAREELQPGDVRAVHCFRTWNGNYVDEKGITLPSPIPPVGDCGVHSFRTIDDMVSDSLQMQRAPLS